MTIKFSRYAKRRMKLYGIDEQDVVDSVRNHLNRVGTESTKYEVVDDGRTKKYKFPLKSVFTLESDVVTIITTYPLKGKRKQ